MRQSVTWPLAPILLQKGKDIGKLSSILTMLKSPNGTVSQPANAPSMAIISQLPRRYISIEGGGKSLMKWRAALSLNPSRFVYSYYPYWIF